MTLLDSDRINFRPFEYPQAYEYWKAQIDHPWTPSKIEVVADVQNYHTEFTEAEKHGVQTVLKLFTAYETQVEDYWVSVIYKYFKAPEVRMMASAFAGMESVHAVFYDKLNDGLGLANKEFYTSFLESPLLVERMDFISNHLEIDDEKELPAQLATSLAAFAFIEGAVLYSSFAFLLSFPKRNKLSNVAGGIAYSVRDENLHAMADCWLFNTLVEEEGLSRATLGKQVKEIAMAAYDVEAQIIDEIFAKGRIADITKKDLKTFAKSRINKKLKDMRFRGIFKLEENPVADWFYKEINAPEFNDFFYTNPSEYTHSWNFDNMKY